MHVNCSNFSGTTTVSSSASSSRNNSPRPLLSESTKLRSNVAHRNQSSLLQRNSVNYTSSTLQEDLMRLINPDYMASDDNFHQGSLVSNRPQKNTQNSHSLGNISVLNGSSALSVAPIMNDELILMRKKSRSREAINLGSHGLPISSDIKFAKPEEKTGADVIFTTARPATVVSGAAITTHSEGNFLHIKEDNGIRQSIRKTAGDYASQMFGSKRKEMSVSAENLMQNPLPLLADSKEVDWTRLVDDAIMQVNEGLKNSEMNKSSSFEQRTETSEDSPLDSSGSSSNGVQQHSSSGSTSLPELQSQVVQLEDRITKETRRRKSLEQAVRRLTEENRRLQDESQAAVQQLRRFTEWFFQTIDRQT